MEKCFYVDFDEANNKLGFNGIALTGTPATKEIFVALKELKLFLNDDLQMLYGPLLVPEQKIRRYTKELGHFDIMFSKEVIAKLARNLQLKSIPFNYEHEPNKIIDGVLQEVWLTGSPDKSNKWGYDLPEGSLFGGVFIKDKDFWLKEVKSNNVKGFSIEANMELQLKQLQMKKIELSEIKAEDGTLIKTDSEVFESGTEVYTEENGERKPLPDCEYKLGNGTTIVVKDSKIAELKESTEAATTGQEAEMTAQLTELLNPILKPFTDKITELETQLAEIKVELSNSVKKEEKKEIKKEVPVKLSGKEMLDGFLKRKSELDKQANKN